MTTSAPALTTSAAVNEYGIPVLAEITDADRKSAMGFEYLEQVLANYGHRITEHGVDYATYTPHPGNSGRRRGGYATCKCGRTFGNANGRGLHEAAAVKRADKIYTIECDTARNADHDG